MIYRRFAGWIRPAALFIFILLAGSSVLNAVETKDGFIRLIIDDNSCSFSLFYLTDTFSEEADAKYEPLFSHKDPRTSFLAVNVNGRTYRLGETSVFRSRIERQGSNPAIVFESPFLIVNDVFSPVRTASSRVANGIKRTITIKNTGDKPASIGLRILIDTHLGERRGDIPFITNSLSITKETIIEGTSGETYWISRGERLSLMGSVVNPPGVTGRNPDFLHFANWKKLSDVPWKAPYYEGRTFNHTQYSIGDSAVCYYWEPVTFAQGESAVFSIFLTTADMNGFTGAKTQAEQQESKKEAIDEAFGEFEEAFMEYNTDYQENEDIIALQRLQGTLDDFISGEIKLTEQELTDIEQSIIRLRTKYDLR